ncbi:MAG: hypothetical protein GF331_25360 [Chitinivibrionales bacterium]|nr:hypothetical protein [Chitinivibrionales bacterium]
MKKALVTLSLAAVPLSAAAALVAWINARRSRRIAAKTGIRLLKWRPARKTASRGLFKAGLRATKHGTKSMRHAFAR